MNKCLCCQGREIPYTIVYKRIKNINLHLREDGSISVSAPHGTPVHSIEEMVLAFAEKRLAFIEARAAAWAKRDRPIASGDRILLFGKLYTIRLEVGRISRLLKTETELIVTLPPNSAHTEYERCVYDYVYRLAKATIYDILIKMYHRHFRSSFSIQTVEFLETNAYWGKCWHLRGTLEFNVRLIHASLSAIEAIVMHELVHFLHPNHSKAFYQTVESYMPDYRKRRNELKNLDVRCKPWHY